MSRLENIGFYTLSDNRARNSSWRSPLWRNELIITSKCNFKCPYCRGTDINGTQRHMDFEEIKKVIDYFASQDIRNIRISGGEPTVHPQIIDIVKYIKIACNKIEHIAISTNGYGDIKLYKELVNCGVNDFSISLDACCSSVGDMMSGGVVGSWNKVVENIKELSKMTYVTVGMVFSEQNANDISKSIEFAHNLGVSDIRIISAAQWNNFEIFKSLKLSEDTIQNHPILKYRLNNFSKGRNVRGISEIDSHKCGLLLDDMIVKGNYHYPCVIKMREGCEPIGKITDPSVRKDRYEYFMKCDCYKDNICKNNCLDVCVDYNNRYERFKIEEQTTIQKLNSERFTGNRWNAGSIHDFGIEHFRYDNAHMYKDVLLKNLEGYCFGENLQYRPKENHVALMYRTENDFMWFHIRNNEFIKLLE